MNIIITGKKHVGKTAAARSLVELLRQDDISVGGFLCEGKDIMDVLTGERHRFLYPQPLEDAQCTGPYAIPNEMFRFGEEAVRAALRQRRYACIDEYGKLELQGGGFHPLVEESLPSGRCIIIVRDLNVEQFLERFKEYPSKIYAVTKESRDSLADNIYKETIF